jgi:ubiquinone/menaquinone biosynthesis C-methylase UbiE
LLWPKKLVKFIFMENQNNEYVLGTGNDELDRLGLQHRIWADAAVRVWRASGIGSGSEVLDLGSGPGYASYDLAQLVGNTGKVLAFDESKQFVDFVNSQAKSRGLSQLSAQIGDAQNISATLSPDKKFDAIYCRWVLCWLPDPEKTLVEARKFLKPNGKFIIHDYFNWKAMTAAPRSPALSRVVAAAVSSFEDRQGNVDICADLPRMLRKSGYQISRFEVDQRVARGGGLDSTLFWITSWWETYTPKLVSLGKVSQADCDQALADLQSLKKDPDQFFFCPPLFEIVASPSK